MPGPGEVLRQTRESLGLPLDEVSRTIHIRPEYLEAIEQDAYSVLPGDVYTRGFLRNYATYLGLDPTAIITAYDTRDAVAHKRGRAPRAATPPAPAPRPPIRIQPLSPTPIDTRVRYAPSFWLMGLLAFVLLILAYLGYNTLSGFQAVPATQPTPTAPPQATAPGLNLPTVLVGETPVWTPFPTPGPSPIPTRPGTPGPGNQAGQPDHPPQLTPGTTPPSGTAVAGLPSPTIGASNGVTVTVTVGSQNAWMLVTVDGKTTWQGVLAAGSSRSWTGTTTVRIRFARGDITWVNVNGQDRGLAGDPTQTVITKEWDAAGNERVIQ